MNGWCWVSLTFNPTYSTIFTADLGFGVVVVRDVPATVCSQCGADWIADAIASGYLHQEARLGPN